MTYTDLAKIKIEQEFLFVKYISSCQFNQKVTLADLKQFDDVLSKSFLEDILQKMLHPEDVVKALHPTVFHEYNVVFKGLKFRSLRYVWLPFHFENCEFIGALLYRSDFTNATFYNCDFSRAKVDRAKGFNPEISLNKGVDNLPQKVDLIGYKKVLTVNRENYTGGIPRVLKVKIPKWAERSKSTSNKCRASAVKPLALFDLDGEEITNLTEYDSIIPSHRITVKHEYSIGEISYPDLWDDNRWNECSNGIHFFMKFEEAKNY